MTMTSSQPYLLRAVYEWIIDNEFTPYLLVNASNDAAQVPRQYVEDGKIVLNISPSAVNELEMGNEFIMFNARFGGKAMEVSFPVQAVLAIYARENGQGMMFDEQNDSPPPGSPPSSPDKPSRPKLKLVK